MGLPKHNMKYSEPSSLIINVSENGISMLAKNTKVALSFIGRSKKNIKEGHSQPY